MTKIHMVGIDPANNAFQEFQKKLLEEIAKITGLTYEQMTSQLDAVARGRKRVVDDLKTDAKSALEHLDKRGYAYRPVSGWCVRPPLASLDLSSGDARAILFLHIVAGLQLPRGIAYAALVDHAFELSANRYVLVDAGDEKVNKIEIKYEDPTADEPDDFNEPPEDLTGMVLRHTGNGKTYQITGSVWLGETDKWGYLHRAMGERGPVIARPLSHIKGKRRNGEPRYEIMNGDLPVHAFETAEARRKAESPELRTHYEGRTPDDGVIRLSQWPEGYILYYHGVAVWRSWTSDIVAKEPDAPQFKPEHLDVLKHALRLWKKAGEDLGIGIRQDYVDGIMNTVLAHTDLDPL